MNRLSKRARLFCSSIVLAVLLCFLAGLEWQRTEAQANNGRIAFTSDNTIYTINADGSGLLKLTPSDNGFFVGIRPGRLMEPGSRSAARLLPSSQRFT